MASIAERQAELQEAERKVKTLRDSLTSLQPTLISTIAAAVVRAGDAYVKGLVERQPDHTVDLAQGKRLGLLKAELKTLTESAPIDAGKALDAAGYWLSRENSPDPRLIGSYGSSGRFSLGRWEYISSPIVPADKSLPANIAKTVAQVLRSFVALASKFGYDVGEAGRNYGGSEQLPPVYLEDGDVPLARQVGQASRDLGSAWSEVYSARERLAQANAKSAWESA